MTKNYCLTIALYLYYTTTTYFIYSKISSNSRDYVLSGGSNADMLRPLMSENRSLTVCVTLTEKWGLPEVSFKQLCLWCASLLILIPWSCSTRMYYFPSIIFQMCAFFTQQKCLNFDSSDSQDMLNNSLEYFLREHSLLFLQFPPCSELVVLERLRWKAANLIHPIN